MIYPNIQIITNIENIYFCDETLYCKKTDRYKHLLLNYFSIDNNTAIVIISQIVDRYKNVINYLKEKNINTIYFFIDDCFRSHLGSSFINTTETYKEIDIIKKIIKKSEIKKFTVFHSEKFDSKIKGISLKYADLFLQNWFIHHVYNNKYFNKSFDFKYKASCLNNRSDIHRHLISAFLCKNKDIFLTFNLHLSDENISQNKFVNLNNFNCQLKNNILNNLKYLKKNKIKYLDKNNINGILDSKYQHRKYVYEYIENSFLNIVTETNFTTDNVFITEKTFKPMLCFRPFIIIGVPNSLEYLKELGFKTFSQWWDESYDQELDHTKRLEKICFLIEDLLSKPHIELKHILSEMSEVLEHNYNNLNLDKLNKFLLPKI